MTTILLIVLILLLLGSFPRWPYSREWGYGPSGIFGLLLIILLIYMFFFAAAAVTTAPVVAPNPSVTNAPAAPQPQ